MASAPARRTARPAPVSGPPRPFCTRLPLHTASLLPIRETGSGKGAAAKALHKLSPRAAGPLVVFDCALVSDSLIERELFGHEKGAFTGAVGQRIGCLQRAHGGTLFLDESDDLALELQPKLLRVLEDREFHRLGASAPVSFDAREAELDRKHRYSLLHKYGLVRSEGD